tara:strand:- start:46 stop:183 length:138 start_codon:yes stop_codon:yes gene_type:complete
MQHHKYSLTEIEDMIPWERDIYVDMLITHIKEENEKQKQREAERK